MSIKTYKILLWTLAIGWAGLSFVFFGQQLQNKTAFNEAQTSVKWTNAFFEEYSKQIKFKLGQWSYNYQLKSSKGVEFDHAAFMESEFDIISFYSTQEVEDAPYEKRWLKAKDFAANELPTTLIQRLQALSFESLKTQPYKWMAGLGEQGQSVVVMLVPVDDPAIGTGVLVGALDLENMPFNRVSSEMLILDDERRFLLHSQKEYLAQKATAIIADVPVGELYFHNSDAYLVSKINGYDYVYRAEKKSILGFVALPLLLLLLGVAFFAGLPLLLQDEPQAYEDSAAFESNANKPADQSDIDFAGYESVLKVQSLREKLNKMVLVSSSLKGRMDLAVMGDSDQRLIKDLQVDFENLDKAIDDAFNEASEFYNTEADTHVATSSFVLPNEESPISTTQNEIMVNTLDKPEVSKLGLKKTDKAKAIETSSAALPKIDESKIVKSKETTPVSPSEPKGFAFEIQEDDIDINFAENLTMSAVDSSSEPKSDAIANTQTGVIKEPAGTYSSALVSESLEEAKFALGNLDDDGDDDPFGDLHELQDIEVSPTEASPSFKVNAKNDWAKVIEELTEELNNLDLDLSEDEIDEVMESSKDETTVAKEKITPPRIEL